MTAEGTLSQETIRRLTAVDDERTGDITIRVTTVKGIEVVIVNGQKVFEKSDKQEEHKVAL